MSGRRGGSEARRGEAPRRLVLTGGGSGGHLYPAISLARALQATPLACAPVFIGTRTGLEARVLPEEGFEFHAVSSRKVTRSRSPGTALSLAVIAWGTLQAGLLLRRLDPVAVVGTGGYASAGVVLAAALQGIPTLNSRAEQHPGPVQPAAGAVCPPGGAHFP